MGGRRHRCTRPRQPDPLPHERIGDRAPLAHRLGAARGTHHHGARPQRHRRAADAAPRKQASADRDQVPGESSSTRSPGPGGCIQGRHRAAARWPARAVRRRAGRRQPGAPAGRWLRSHRRRHLVPQFSAAGGARVGLRLRGCQRVRRRTGDHAEARRITRFHGEHATRTTRRGGSHRGRMPAPIQEAGRGGEGHRRPLPRASGAFGRPVHRAARLARRQARHQRDRGLPVVRRLGSRCADLAARPVPFHRPRRRCREHPALAGALPEGWPAAQPLPRTGRAVDGQQRGCPAAAGRGRPTHRERHARLGSGARPVARAAEHLRRLHEGHAPRHRGGREGRPARRRRTRRAADLDGREGRRPRDHATHGQARRDQRAVVRPAADHDRLGPTTEA